MKKLGKKGGKARSQNLNDKQRGEIAKLGAAARWKDHQKDVSANGKIPVNASANGEKCKVCGEPLRDHFKGEQCK